MPDPRAEVARELKAGARVGGKYRLVRRIAVGGMGEVWRARNETTEAEVALKVSRRTAGDELDARFRTEARLGSMLSHRSIVRIFDLVEEDDGSLVLVMELLRGESLAQQMKAVGKLSTKEAVAIAVPVLSALSHAHAEGIVHRDVTPANIILAVDPDGHVTPKLIDFGIAKLPAAGVHTLDGRALGTPRYMAPEQIRGQLVDGRTDLFSLALVLYESITGVCPFDAASPSASLAAVLEAPVDPDPQIELGVWLELKRALGKRPYERHANAAEMAAALVAAVGETEASLAALLRRAPPSRSQLDAAEEHAPLGPSTVEGQSAERPLARRRWTWTPWAAAGAIAASVVGLTAVALRRVPQAEATSRPNVAAIATFASSAPPPSTAPPNEILPAAAASNATPALSPSESIAAPTALASPGSVEGTPAGHASARPVPPPPARAHPRRIGATPGF
jgi:serine/threonine-protein kinase